MNLNFKMMGTSYQLYDIMPILDQMGFEYTPIFTNNRNNNRRINHFDNLAICVEFKRDQFLLSLMNIHDNRTYLGGNVEEHMKFTEWNEELFLALCANIINNNLHFEPVINTYVKCINEKEGFKKDKLYKLIRVINTPDKVLFVLEKSYFNHVIVDSTYFNESTTEEIIEFLKDKPSLNFKWYIRYNNLTIEQKDIINDWFDKHCQTSFNINGLSYKNYYNSDIVMIFPKIGLINYNSPERNVYFHQSTINSIRAINKLHNKQYKEISFEEFIKIKEYTDAQEL